MDGLQPATVVRKALLGDETDPLGLHELKTLARDLPDEPAH
ncbi:hypothetical protein [Yinghuangia aomiensis]